jgi:hypothetical protein
LGSAFSLAGILGFVGVCLYAKLNPAWAAEVVNTERAAALPFTSGPRAPLIRESARADEPPKANPAPKGGKGKKKSAPETTKSSVTGPVPVTAKKLDFHGLAKLIDNQVAKRMVAEGFKPSPRADDAEFLRRVYLDLVGVVPSADKVEAFLADTNPKKREKVIDELLADPRFGTALAEAWSYLMLPRDSNNRLLDPGPLRQWLAKEFNGGVPLNKLVFDLVTASGSTEENGATTYFLANAGVDKITDNVTRMFLGVQLQCAQCHNHPFTDWKQNEYWGMAAFFMKTKPSMNPQMAAKKGVAPSISETAVKGFGKKGALPESAKIVPAKFLQGETPRLNPSEPFRPVLARWMTSPTNPFFARAMVNRFWYQLFGRGIVQPVDDMHQENPPTHPELLAALAEQFKSSGFDTKFLLRAICNSETYQRSSRATEENKADDKFLSHRVVRVLSPPQLYDSLVTVMGDALIKKLEAKAAQAKGPMLKKGGAGPRQQFINFFRIDEGADPLEYQAGIPQALRMMNAPLFNNSTDTIAKASQEGDNVPSEVIRRLYLRALARWPSAEETDRLLGYMRKNGGVNPRNAYGDMLWALVNSSEFAFNH